MIQLSSVIQELFEVANVQLDILSRIKVILEYLKRIRILPLRL